jgi:hypothetical protein
MFQRILILVVLALSAALNAGDVAATLLKVNGGGQLYGPDGAKLAYQAGAKILPGSRLVTQEGGLAVLLMADGSKVSVGPNTDITLSSSKEDGGTRSTVFDLVKGLFRATVEKLTVGSVFQVKTSDAVAAVKGTDFQVAVDDGGTEASVVEGTVWMDTVAGERAVLEKEMAARAERHGKLGLPRRLSPQEIENFGKWAREAGSPHSGAFLPADEAKREAWSRLRPEQRARVWNALAESMGGDFWHDVTGLRAEERQERWRDRLRETDERRLATEGARVDFALGKTALDRQGRRVRFDEFLARPAPDQLQFLNYTRRDDRTDLISAINTYNQALPQNLSDAPGLNQRLWLQGLANPPQYWVTSSSIVAGNSSGDSFAATTGFYDPYYRFVAGYWELPVESVQVRLNVPDLQAPTVGGLLVESWQRQYVGVNPVVAASGLNAMTGQAYSVALAARAVPGSTNNIPVNSLDGATPAPNTVATDINNTNLVWALGNSTTLPITTLLTLDGLEAKPGDLAFGFTRTYQTAGVAGVTLEFRNYVIDENGNIVNLAGIPPDQLMKEFIDRGLIASLKELQLQSNQFSDPDGIDVVSKLLFLHDLSKSNDQL